LCNFKSAKHVHLFQDLKTLGSDEPKGEAYFLGLSKKAYGDGYKGRIQATAKHFLRWLYSKRLIELPRNLDDGALVFEDHAKEIKLLEFSTVRKFIAAATVNSRSFPQILGDR
jgi:hypothetical protein